jgi:hypothetical protein
MKNIFFSKKTFVGRKEQLFTIILRLVELTSEMVYAGQHDDLSERVFKIKRN